MKPVLLLLAVATVAAPAFAHDDEMMGTIVNGRMESRNERFYRVQDQDMDREEMIIDREKRQGRQSVNSDIETDPRLRERKPYEGPLPD